MNCATHSEIAAVAFCRNCGRAVCDACRQEWQGVPHCSDCVEKLSPAEPPVTASADAGAAASKQTGDASGAYQRSAPSTSSPPPGPVSSAVRPPSAGSWDGPSPALAFLAGLIPGVGAVYNGQYAKGVVHALVWGGLLSTAIATEQTGPPGSVAVFIVLLVMTTLYMPIEAVHTARAVRRGEPVDEFWGLFGLWRGPGGSPVGGVLLILMGVVFLLHSLGYWRLGDAARFWPVTLIALGIYLLYRRVKEQSAGAAPAPPEGSSGSALPSIRVSDPASAEDGPTVSPESVATPLDESPAEQTSRAPVEEPQRAG